jgi:hypothetical protein
MGKMTVNDLIGKIAVRARELADWKLDALRAEYPETTETRAELVRLCKERGLTRGQMIEAILVEEFTYEFDVEIR